MQQLVSEKENNKICNRIQLSFDGLLKDVQAINDLSGSKLYEGNVSQIVQIKQLTSKKLNQCVSGSESVIKKSSDDINPMPEVVCSATEVNSGISKAEEFFDKSLNSIKVLSLYALDFLTPVARPALNLIEVTVDQYDRAITYRKDQAQRKKIIEMGDPRQQILPGDLKSNNMQMIKNRPVQDNKTLLANSSQAGNKSSSWFSLPLYVYEKDFLFKSMGAGMLVVGLSALAYKLRHKAKSAFLKIKNLFLDKKNDTYDLGICKN